MRMPSNVRKTGKNIRALIALSAVLLFHSFYAGSDSFRPETKAYYPANWKNTDFNVIMECNDYTGFGCKDLNYKIDANSWLSKAYNPDKNWGINTDNKWAQFKPADPLPDSWSSADT